MSKRFDLESWKRAYMSVNIADRDEVKDTIVGLMTNLNMDNAHYLYISHYKGTLPMIDYIRNNRISGYFQQLDQKLRRITFCSGYYNVTTQKVSFVWIFRDTDLPNMVKNSSIFDACTWNKIDPITDDHVGILSDLIFPETASETYAYK